MIDSARIFDGDEDYIKEFRHLVRTDAWLCAEAMGYDKFDRVIHADVADLYIVKNCELPIEDQDEIKNRMHLDPRATYKSTWGFVDSYQWIVNFANMTIVNETSTQPLGKAQTTTLASNFSLPKGRQPTILQKAFPEYNVDYLIDGDHECEAYFAPCRTYNQPDATIDSTSVKSAQAGWHPWLLNADDTVDVTNSGKNVTENVRQGVIDKHNTNINTIRPGGYLNIRGTRYHPFDLYGVTLQKMVPEMWKTLIRSSISTKNGKRLIEGEFPLPSELVNHFEGILSYSYLRQKFMEDYVNFMCQQQNDPMGGAKAIFPKELYHSILSAPEFIAPFGETYVCWRLPFDDKDFMRDYAEGAAMRYHDNRGYVIDAWRGDYTPTELAEKIVDSLKRTMSRQLILEMVPGYSHVVDDVKNEMARRSWSARIDLKDFDSNDTTRSARCKSLEPLMRSGRLRISTGITQAIETRAQFETYGLIMRNGIIDTISRLASRLPASIVNRAISEEQKFIHDLNRGKASYDAIYGQRGGSEVVEEAIREVPKSSKSNSYGLRSMLGGLDG